MTTPGVIPSKVPVALVALTAQIQAGFADSSGVQVVDGDEVNLEDEYVRVGWVPANSPRDAVEVARQPGDLRMRHNHDTFDVMCQLSTYDGDSNVPDRRARAFDMFTAVDNAIAADRKLGGAVQLSQIIEYSLSQQVSGSGATASISFVVRIIAI